MTDSDDGKSRPTAVITGASAGLGRALARALARSGWRLVIDARRAAPLQSIADELAATTQVAAISGDIADPAHRRALVEAADGRIDVLINNASELGGSPLPRLRDLDAESFARVWQVNVASPLALIRAALPAMTRGAVLINISSDAAVGHDATWGGYGASKAALDHLTLTLATEEPAIRCYAVDPGDLRTAMHQAAFPGEDISDRPEPESVVSAFTGLIDSGLPSGRYRAAELVDLITRRINVPGAAPDPAGAAR